MIANATTAAASASTIVHPKSPQPGPPKCGSGNGLSDHALVLRPENDPSPMKTREPMPAATRPGSRTTGSTAPPRPVASMMITAPITGDPKMVEMAAKLPAAPISARPCSGASGRSVFIARMPSPMPSAISGDSGPRTSPRPRVATAARTMPGRSIGRVGGPPVLRPSAGTWPPCPGSRRIANAVRSPAIASQGSGHQAGTVS